MNPYIINMIGLVMDIIGVVLIFFFAIPGNGIGKKDKESVMIVSTPEWYKYFKWLGLALVIIGFSCQFISSYKFL